jgi:WD40 repeat protein
VISKDGELMASGSDDQSIMVWNINKDNPVHKFIAHDNVI